VTKPVANSVQSSFQQYSPRRREHEPLVIDRLVGIRGRSLELTQETKKKPQLHPVHAERLAYRLFKSLALALLMHVILPIWQIVYRSSSHPFLSQHRGSTYVPNIARQSGPFFVKTYVTAGERNILESTQTGTYAVAAYRALTQLQGSGRRKTKTDNHCHFGTYVQALLPMSSPKLSLG
jgi:hypothetical protein